MRLIPVDPANEEHLRVLYDLLAERTPEQSISHREMPTWEEHRRHVASKMHDYAAGRHKDWCLIQNAAGIVGAVYLTNNKEIGISIFREFQRHGFGPAAVRMMMEKHALKMAIANVNPANHPSIAMFEKRFNAKLIQFTYEIECPGAD